MVCLVSCIVKSQEIEINNLNFNAEVLNGEELVKKDAENISFKKRKNYYNITS